jgi:hypothetical protein
MESYELYYKFFNKTLRYVSRPKHVVIPTVYKNNGVFTVALAIPLNLPTICLCIRRI